MNYVGGYTPERVEAIDQELQKNTAELRKEAATRPWRAKRRGWGLDIILWVLVLLGLGWQIARAEEPAFPTPISSERKIEILHGQIKVYLKMLEKLRAELTALRAEKDITGLNDSLGKIENDVRKETGAGPGWEVNEFLDWKTVNVPVIQVQEVKK
jgi:ribosomal protein L29